MKREMTVELSSEGFFRTGLRSDVTQVTSLLGNSFCLWMFKVIHVSFLSSQHALLFPVLISHLRFHRCLFELEKKLKFSFKNRILLQVGDSSFSPFSVFQRADSIPSFWLPFSLLWLIPRTAWSLAPTPIMRGIPSLIVAYASWNMETAGSIMSTPGREVCCYRYVITTCRFSSIICLSAGINTLFFIMSKLGCKEEVQSEIFHYERLEFLGDAIVEFLSRSGSDWRFILVLLDLCDLYKTNLFIRFLIFAAFICSTCFQV